MLAFAGARGERVAASAGLTRPGLVAGRTSVSARRRRDSKTLADPGARMGTSPWGTSCLMYSSDGSQ